MPLTASFSHLRTVLAVPFLAVMLAFPACAEPTPDASPAQQTEPSAPSAQTGTDGAPPPHAVNQDSQDAVEEPDAATDDTDSAPDGAPDSDDAATAPAAPEKPKSRVLIDIDKSIAGDDRLRRRRAAIFLAGVDRHGAVIPPRPEPILPRSMNEIWYSKQWDNAPMPHPIFFTKQGHAIHGTKEVKRLGKPPRMAVCGCLRKMPRRCYALVKANGLAEDPGRVDRQDARRRGAESGEPRQVSETGGLPAMVRARRLMAIPAPQQKKRRGMFGRRWFQDGPQGYYVPRGNRYYYLRGEATSPSEVAASRSHLSTLTRRDDQPGGRP